MHLIYSSNLLGISTSLSKMQLLTYFPQQWCLILPCPLILMRHLDFSQSVFQHGLICISPINNANEHLSLFLLAICVSSMKHFLFSYFSFDLYECSFLTCRCYLSTLKKNSSIGNTFCKYFFSAVTCFFFLLWYHFCKLYHAL